MSGSLEVTPTDTAISVLSPEGSDGCFVVPYAAEASRNLSRGLSEVLSGDNAPNSELLTRTVGANQGAPVSSAQGSLPPLPDTPERAIRHPSPSPSRLFSAIASGIGIGCKHRQDSRDSRRVPGRSAEQTLSTPKDCESEVVFGGPEKSQR